MVINSSDDYDDHHNEQQVNVTCPQQCAVIPTTDDVDVKSCTKSETLFTNVINEIPIVDDNKTNSTNSVLIDGDKSKSMIEAEESMDATIHDKPTVYYDNDDEADKSSMLSANESIVINNESALVNCQVPVVQPQITTKNNLVSSVALSCEKKVETNNNMSQMSLDEEVQQHIGFEERIILGIEHNNDTKSNIEIAEQCQQDKEIIGKQEAAQQQDGYDEGK